METARKISHNEDEALVVRRKYARNLTANDVVYTMRGPLFVFSVKQVHPQIIRVDYDNSEQVDMFGPDNVVEILEWL